MLFAIGCARLVPTMRSFAVEGWRVSIKRWTFCITRRLASIRSSRCARGSASFPRAISFETSVRWRTINSSDRPMQARERAISSSSVMAACLHAALESKLLSSTRAQFTHRIVLILCPRGGRRRRLGPRARFSTDLRNTESRRPLLTRTLPVCAIDAAVGTVCGAGAA